MDLKAEMRKVGVELNEVKDQLRTIAAHGHYDAADLRRLGQQHTALEDKQRSLVVAIREQEGGVS